MISIKSASIVVPSEPTPSGILWLFESDQLMQWTHAPLIMVYKSTNETNAAQLFEAYSDAELEELGDFAPTDVVENLVPKIDYSTPIEKWPLLLVQLTRFAVAGVGAVTSPCLCGDLLSKPLGYAARTIREAKEKMTDEYIRSALDFITSQEDVSPLRNNIHIRGYSEAPFLGNPNISTGSWMNLPFYAADFGWGKPTYVGPGVLNTDGKSFIMPSPEDDGSLIIALRLQAEYMDSFKKFFYQDMHA
ncbi:Spermidine hydroxycinnamoyl transferase [Morella rubra]|uniref:Spermidine hydroxycinnamoyl transferase n=1 Tax=Morella rubra TaxID=262757 RepID=A0A6A1UM68_9ROSI|nr:Spermidine hydroxycinnamoyl transferase [Morella rubra]